MQCPLQIEFRSNPTQLSQNACIKETGHDNDLFMTVVGPKGRYPDGAYLNVSKPDSHHYRDMGWCHFPEFPL